MVKLAEKLEFPIIKALIEKGLIRNILAMPSERRRIIITNLLLETASWAIGMGIGRMVMGLIRTMLEEAGVYQR